MATIAACLTPAGTGAIATIALHGPNAWAIVNSLQQSKRTPATEAQLILGKLGAEVADQVVVTKQTIGPNDRVEVHCHGGTAVVRWLLDLLCQHGATIVSWEEWLRHTFASKLQAEAANALAHATTLRTANILLDQYHGALERSLRHLASLIEADEEATALTELDALLKYAPIGLHLTKPWRIVLAGAPNVGKSSLANALLGYQRAITSPIPGTTRDVVAAPTAIEGWPVEIVDTAGVRPDAADLEAEGIRRAHQAGATADLVLWVLDQSQPPVLPEPADRRLIVVLNKSDLPAAWDVDRVEAQTSLVRVSATLGTNIAGLLKRIAEELVPNPPAADAAVPFSQPIVAALQQARDALYANLFDDALSALASQT